MSAASPKADGSRDSYFAVLNPAAGGGRCGRRAPAALARLRGAGLDVEVARTEGPGDGVRLAAEAYAAGFRRFIAIGGDGTTHELLNGVLPAAIEGERCAIGFLPLGTGNSFLRDFGESAEQQAASALCTGRMRPCDVIELRHAEGVTYFINILSFGFVADVNALANRRFKPLGQASYAIAVVLRTATLRSRPLVLRLDDRPAIDDPLAFVAISNSRFTGGKMMMAPEADTADGLVDVVVVRELSRLSLLRTFPKIFSGTHIENPAVSYSRARRIVFDVSERLDAMIDGEVARLQPRELEVVPSAIDVLV